MLTERLAEALPKKACKAGDLSSIAIAGQPTLSDAFSSLRFGCPSSGGLPKSRIYTSSYFTAPQSRSMNTLCEIYAAQRISLLPGAT